MLTLSSNSLLNPSRENTHLCFLDIIAIASNSCTTKSNICHTLLVNPLLKLRKSLICTVFFEFLSRRYHILLSSYSAFIEMNNSGGFSSSKLTNHSRSSLNESTKCNPEPSLRKIPEMKVENDWIRSCLYSRKEVERCS